MGDEGVQKSCSQDGECLFRFPFYLTFWTNWISHLRCHNNDLATPRGMDQVKADILKVLGIPLRVTTDWGRLDSGRCSVSQFALFQALVEGASLDSR